jgi:hypothetical protein
MIKLRKTENDKWVAHYWSKSPDGSWRCINALRNRSGKYNNQRSERKDPRELAKAAVKRWCSTHE